VQKAIFSELKVPGKIKIPLEKNRLHRTNSTRGSADESFFKERGMLRCQKNTSLTNRRLLKVTVLA